MKLNIKLKNCYGINDLEEILDFSASNTLAIYSPNGLMKTSLAKTFKDLSLEQDSTDLVFPDRTTVREISNEDGDEIPPEEVFVIEPYNEHFNSDKLSTLLVTKELKEEYDSVYQELEDEKNGFVTKLKAVSQSSDCETEFINTFSETDKDTFFDLLKTECEKLSGNLPKYEFRYNDVFDKNGKVAKFLAKHKSSLELYAENYEKLISESSFFKKSGNTFGTYQASQIHRAVSDNSFFEAGHQLELSDNTKLGSENELKERLSTEISNVVEDAELKEIFDKVDKDIGANAELRAFKAVIEKDNLLLVELRDYEEFKKKVWLGYLDQLREDANNLINLYDSKKQKVEDIIKKAKEEKTDWEKCIGDFNERFKRLPFKLSMSNKEDVLLKTSTPVVEFTFHDEGDERVIDRDELLTVLSHGERRALYLLNIIFEIEARKKENLRTIFVMDDIADSFDYKNKYAIIEYLSDISKTTNFFQIILTHNFDFFRTIESRGIVRYAQCYYAYKSSLKISLEKASGIKNPFIRDWKDNLDENKKLISSIPFIRNIIEYTKGEENSEYQKLTSLLHWKGDTESILLSDLQPIFEGNIDGVTFPDNNLTAKVVDAVFQEADGCLSADDGINFENKIVLSIALRLKAEKFMVEKIQDPSFISSISSNQTIKLVEKYKELFPNEESNINILEQVNLMTPETIHINNFMYEPILDLGDAHLKDLYRKVKTLS